jgi:hypothetical protein
MRRVLHVKAVAVVGAVEARAEAEDAAGTAVAVAVDAAVVDRAAVVVVEAVTNRRNSPPHFAKRTAETALAFLLV